MAWTFAEQKTEAVAASSTILDKVLANRGIEQTLADQILNNPFNLLLDPLGLVNMEQGVNEIIEAIEDNKEIWVFADYDADGMTSGYILSDFLQTVTTNDVYPYYPNREEGYALSVSFAEEMIKRKEEGFDVFIITVDNGTSCHEPIDLLKSHGINVLVTDHHQPKETLPACTIINPQIVKDDTYKHLCGAGVALKVVQAMEILCNLEDDYSSKYYTAAMIGTIADMMPLTIENMALIRLGLLQANGKEAPIAIREWKRFLGKKQLTPVDIGWEIGPRLNACGRMGQSDLGGLLLSCKENTDKAEVRNILLEIEDLNQERKALTDKAKKEMDNYDYGDHYVCMFDASAYPVGIAGILAGKLLEKTGKPSLVYSGSRVVTGSSRSPIGFNLQDMLNEEFKKGNILSFGGHEEACGFKFDITKKHDLQESMDDYAGTFYGNMLDGIHGFEGGMIEVDDELTLSDITMENFLLLNSFAYDRQVFTSPVFVWKNLSVESVKRSKNKQENICLTLSDGNRKMMVWGWNQGSLYEEIGSPNKINIIGELDIDFMNKSKVTIRIKEMEAAE